MYASAVNGERFAFRDLADLLAKATPFRSGDALAGVAALSESERVAAQQSLADLPLSQFLNDAVIPYETDDVTRLIVDSHDGAAFRAISHLTVGGLRDWLLSDDATPETLAGLSAGFQASGRHALPQHARSARAAFDEAPAQPPL